MKIFKLILTAAVLSFAASGVWAAELSTEKLLGEMGVPAGTLPQQSVGAIQENQQISNPAVIQEDLKPKCKPPARDVVRDIVKENLSAIKIVEYGDAPVTVSASKVSNIISVPYDIESISSSKFCPDKTTSAACINPDHIGRSQRQLIFPGVVGQDTDLVIVTSKKTYALSLAAFATTPVYIQIRNKASGKREMTEPVECPKSFPVVEKLYETIIAAIRDGQIEGYTERNVSLIHDTARLLFVANRILEDELWSVAFIDIVNKSKTDVIQVKENSEEVQTAISKLVGVPLISSLSREFIQPQNPKTIANHEDIATLVVIAERREAHHE
jgi:hypothetical protein